MNAKSKFDSVENPKPCPQPIIQNTEYLFITACAPLPKSAYKQTASSPDYQSPLPKLLSSQKKKKKPFNPLHIPLLMGKKKNASAGAAAGTSSSKVIDNLKTLNFDLGNEVAELRGELPSASAQNNFSRRGT
ncbi:hypothetical protein KFK09_001277 [Dendrobium nobile]|uniref:Uncharacterized protein n=1 Tax=Dendrobium nobile TaxID=94219 RepID=A0A8T3CAD8_DENNO|nr:hypothetical protein KFK09_001277 [Dendrobium nobile]